MAKSGNSDYANIISGDHRELYHVRATRSNLTVSDGVCALRRIAQLLIFAQDFYSSGYKL